MRCFLNTGWSRLCVIILGILLLGVASFQFLTSNKQVAPNVLKVSTCKPLEPGIRRIGNRSGLQFDVDTSQLSIREGTQDTPAVAHGFYLRPNSGNSGLNILFGPLDIQEGTA